MNARRQSSITSSTRAATPRAVLLALVILGASLVIAVWPVPLSAENERQPSTTIRGAQATQAARVASIDKRLDQLPKARVWKQGDPVKETNPRRHYARVERTLKVPKPTPKPDPLRAIQARAAAFVPERSFEPLILNIDGQGFSGVNPPDTVGDVGTDHFIQAINDSGGTLYTVYKKAGGSVAAGPFRLSDLGDPSTQGAGDPIVLFDEAATRWVLCEFGPQSDPVLHVYVSKTADPIAGGWHYYRFPTPQFPDYPKFGVWHDAYYATTNESTGPAIYAFDRAKMLNGQPATMQRFSAGELTGFGFQALTPADIDGPAPPAGTPHYLMRHHDDEVHNVGSSDPGQDFLDLFECKIDWANPANSTLSGPVGIPIAEIDSDLNGLTSFSCFPQKGSSIKLDPLREVIMNRLQYRNFGTHETLVGAFVTDVDGSDHGGVRWFELRKSGGSSWHVHQEGTYAPDGHHRWLSSIAMDGRGNVAMVYNVTSSTIFPGLRYVGRLAGDPMGTMPRGEHVLIDGTAPNNSFRYGDYSAISVDPSDDQVFWVTGQYNAAGAWSTRIGAFRFAASHSQPPTGEPVISNGNNSNLEKRVRALEEKLEQLLKEREKSGK